MPLTLETVNLISDGDAVTANALNAPSVNLVNRTDAIKSSYDVVEDERRTLQGYSALLTGGTRPTVSVTAGEVTPGGDKYYYISLSSGGYLRYYSPNSSLGRIQLSATQLSSYNNNQGNTWSKHLVREGDTLAIELDSHATLEAAGPRSLRGASQDASSDIDNAFYSVDGDVDLVKLPLRRTVQFTCDLTVATLLAALNQEASEISSEATYSLSSSGVLNTSNSDGVELEVSADGGTLYGTVYSITESTGKLYITTTATTSFLDYTNSPGTIKFRVSKDGTEEFYTPTNQANKSLPAAGLSQDKFYIPVATLEAGGVRFHGIGKCPLPEDSGDVEVLGPEGRSTRRYIPGETYTVETVLSRLSTDNTETTAVVSIPDALADQIQDYGGHVLLRAFSITTLASFADNGTQPTFTATVRLDLSGFTTTSQVLASSIHMPPVSNYLETGINLLADATASSFGLLFAYEPSVSVTVSGLAPDADAKALLRLSFSYVPA